MKNKNIKESSLDELNNFSDIVDPLVEFLEGNWDVNPHPKNYDKNKDNYDNFSDEKLIYNGLNSCSATSPSIEDKLSTYHIGYDDIEQGRSPFRVLVGSLVGFGMQVGEQRNKLEIKEKLKGLDISDLSEKLIIGTLTPEETVILSYMLVDLHYMINF